MFRSRFPLTQSNLKIAYLKQAKIVADKTNKPHPEDIFFDDECPIGMHEYDEYTPGCVITPCGHKYCNECLDTYKKKFNYTDENIKCPLCRRENSKILYIDLEISRPNPQPDCYKSVCLPQSRSLSIFSDPMGKIGDMEVKFITDRKYTVILGQIPKSSSYLSQTVVIILDASESMRSVFNDVIKEIIRSLFDSKIILKVEIILFSDNADVEYELGEITKKNMNDIYTRLTSIAAGKYFENTSLSSGIKCAWTRYTNMPDGQKTYFIITDGANNSEDMLYMRRNKIFSHFVEKVLSDNGKLFLCSYGPHTCLVQINELMKDYYHTNFCHSSSIQQFRNHIFNRCCSPQVGKDLKIEFIGDDIEIVNTDCIGKTQYYQKSLNFGLGIVVIVKNIPEKANLSYIDIHGVEHVMEICPKQDVNKDVKCFLDVRKIRYILGTILNEFATFDKPKIRENMSRYRECISLIKPYLNEVYLRESYSDIMDLYNHVNVIVDQGPDPRGGHKMLNSVRATCSMNAAYKAVGGVDSAIIYPPHQKSCIM